MGQTDAAQHRRRKMRESQPDCGRRDERRPSGCAGAEWRLQRPVGAANPGTVRRGLAKSSAPTRDPSMSGSARSGRRCGMRSDILRSRPGSSIVRGGYAYWRVVWSGGVRIALATPGRTSAAGGSQRAVPVLPSAKRSDVAGSQRGARTAANDRELYAALHLALERAKETEHRTPMKRRQYIERRCGSSMRALGTCWPSGLCFAICTSSTCGIGRPEDALRRIARIADPDQGEPGL